MVTNLRETYKTIENQAKALRESARLTNHKEKDFRDIAKSNKVAVGLFGEQKAIELSEAIFESPDRCGALKQKLYEAEASGKLRETNAETAFNTLLRLGVQNIMAKAFLKVPQVGESIRMTIPSNAFIQPYAGTFRAGLPSPVGAGDEFPETPVQGYGALIENLKFGDILSYQQEALDDDQTGELQMKVEEIGENMSIYEELAFAATLSDTALTEGSLTFTPLTYTDPDGTTGVYKSSGLRQNRPSSFATIGLGTLRTARRLLKAIRQPDGQKVLVQPDSIVYHPADEQLVDILLKSPQFPAGVAAASAYGDSTGQMGAINPIQGMYQKFECRYLNYAATNSGAWFVGQRKSRSIIWQERTGLQVVQEAPNSGASFSRQLVRWRTNKRGQMFFFPSGARFWFCGNDGAS